MQNIGYYGMGLHCIATERFNHLGLCEKTEGFVLPSRPSPDLAIEAVNRRIGRGYIGREASNLLEKVQRVSSSLGLLFDRPIRGLHRS